MRLPLRKERDESQQAYSCKECKLSFSSKESLERHKSKAGHSSGWIYFGKNDR
jgi:hypothetical protein